LVVKGTTGSSVPFGRLTWSPTPLAAEKRWPLRMKVVPGGPDAGATPTESAEAAKAALTAWAPVMVT
jgi:hypothetical protein